MRTTHFRHVALRATAFDEAVDFYTATWGLRLVQISDEVAYLRGTSTEHHVLELHRAASPGLDHLAFAVESQAAVDAAAKELASRGDVSVVSKPSALKRPGGGYGFRIVDPEGRMIEFSSDVEQLEKIAEPDEHTWAVRPKGVSHIVLNTADIDSASSFFTSVLGLRVSDWSEHQMVFLRSSTEHHCIAFNQAKWASVNHVAYEVDETGDVMRGMSGMKRAGREILWGPGQHGVGRHVFCYFQDPSGYVIEYTAENIRVDEETWQPRVWDRTPEIMDRWGTSGPPTPEARAAMAGVADPGPFARQD